MYDILIEDRNGARRFKTALPMGAEKGKPLVFREWKNGDELEEAVFNTRVPKESCDILEPDVLLVPLLAFDERKCRLGYGGGFYDRTISALKAKKSVFSLGVAYEAQKVEEVPTEETTDVALDAILTERTIYI